jgi:hypothetical protein
MTVHTTPTVHTAADRAATREATNHTALPHAFVVEVDGATVGIVVRDGEDDNDFRFYASTHAVNALEQQRFRTPRAAQRAAQTLLRNRRLPRAA